MMRNRLHRFLRPDVSWRRLRSLSTATARDVPTVAKKTGKRIPRAERKAMVEQYVNEYRALNPGKFPGVDNTKKHVGGGHYTIRSILQELAYNSKSSAVDPAGESSTLTKSPQDNRIHAVKECVGPEMLLGKIAEEESYINSAENGNKISTASIDTPFQVSIEVLEAPGLVEKTLEDGTVKASETEDSVIYEKLHCLSDVPDISRSKGLCEVTEPPAVYSLNRNALVREGAEANATTIADSRHFASQGEVDSNCKIKVDTSVLTHTSNESEEELSGNNSHVDLGLERTSSLSISRVGKVDDSGYTKGEELLENSSLVEKTSADLDVKASAMEESHFSAYRGHASEALARDMSTNLGKVDEASSQRLQHGELSRKTPEHGTRDNDQRITTLWGNLKSIASSFINVWRKT